MNFKTTYLLAGTLVGLVFLFVLVRTFQGKPGSDTYVMSDMHKADVKDSDINAVEIERNRPRTERLVFAREGNTWHMTEPPFRIQSFMVEQLVRDVLGARRDENADLSGEKGQYGLDQPAEVITLRAGDGREWKMRVGNERLGMVYVTSSADPGRPQAVTRSSLDALFKNVNDYRSKDLLSSTEGEVVAVTVHEAKHPPVVLDKAKAGKWRFEKPDYGEADSHAAFAPAGSTKEITSVDQLLSSIDQVRVASDADFVADGVKDWAKYGLDKPGLTITLKQKPLGSGADKKTAEHTLYVGKKEDKGDKVYVRLAGEDSVERVALADIDPIKKVAADPAVLRNRDLVDVDQSRVDAIDVKNAGGLVKLRRVGGDWQLFDAQGRASKTQPGEVEDLLSSLTRRRQVVSFPTPGKEADLGFQQPAAVVVSLWENGLQPPPRKDDTAKKDEQKKDDKNKAKKKEEPRKPNPEPRLKDPQKPTVQLTFGKKVDNDVNVRRVVGKETTLVRVPATLLEKVGRGRLAYLDRTLPTFPSATDVTKLSIHRDGQTFELTKDDKKSSAWKLTQPPEKGVRTADSRNVTMILAELKGLTAERLVSEKAGDADLKSDGLKPPKLSATVTLKDGKKYEYLFGNDARDGVYAKESGSDFIFVAAHDVAKALEGELRARNLFQFQPTNIKELRLTGWKSVYKFSLTLDLARQADRTWKVKTGPHDLKLDQDKVNGLLEALTDPARPLVERFVAGGVKPEYKLGKDDRLLEIDFVLDDGKTTTLTVGALDTKANAYYAQSSVAPKEVFLVPKAHLEQLLAGAEYFSKK